MFFVICLCSQKEEGIQLKVHLKVGNQATNRAAIEEVRKIIIFVLFFYVYIIILN
jgi:hypothetical protein